MKFTLMLRKWFWNGIACIVLASFGVSAAIATPITYVFSGPATGTLGTTTFTGAQVTVTAAADTGNITTDGGNPAIPCINLTSVVINVAGVGSATATAPNAIADAQGSGSWVLLGGTCAVATSEWLGQLNPLAATYGLITSIGPTTATSGGVFGSVPTPSGTLTFTAPPLTFQATLASSVTADQSDLWFIPTESGWGMQLVERGTVIFATLFVYGPTGTPTWYTATMDFTSGETWSGTLYATTGTYFGVPWIASALTLTRVGTMTWTAQTVDTGTLTYVVNGVTVVKNVIRQTLVLVDYSGHYGGGLHDTLTGCTTATDNGTFDRGSVLEVTQSGSAIAVQNNDTNGVTCSYAGTLTQSGQMGAIPGAAFACSDGSAGTISVDQLQVNSSGITGTFTATYSTPSGCQASGWFGGYRGTTF